MIYKFYDTAALAEAREHIFDNLETERPVINTWSLNKLKDLSFLTNRKDDYDIHIYEGNMIPRFAGYKDIESLMAAIDYDDKVHPDETIFVSNSIALRQIANQFFGEDSIEKYTPKDDRRLGYQELYLNEDQLAKFYSNLNFNSFDNKINEYVIIYDNNTGELVDTRKWTGNEYVPIRFKAFESTQLGVIRPMKKDVYQQLAFDSLISNKITMLKGPAGSGKTIISLGYLFSELERGKLDKIVIFCNTVATKDAARLGFYPGTRDTKLLDSQIGNLLASKLGGMVAVEKLIHEEKLILLPMSDIRGYDTSGMRAGVYISEAQNMSIPLMKLVLQRIGEDSVCIIDGDDKAQVDDENFSGENNGMRRVSQVFAGHQVYGEVELKYIHRSQIAEIAEFL